MCAARTDPKGSSWVVFPFYQLVGFQQGCWACFCSLCYSEEAHQPHQGESSANVLGTLVAFRYFTSKRVSLILFVIPLVVLLVAIGLPGADGSPWLHSDLLPS